MTSVLIASYMIGNPHPSHSSLEICGCFSSGASRSIFYRNCFKINILSKFPGASLLMSHYRRYHLNLLALWWDLSRRECSDCTNAAAPGATFGTLSATILRFRLCTVQFSTSTLAVPQSNSSKKRDFFSLIAWVLAMCVTSLSEVKITLTSQTLWKGVLTIPSAQYFFGMLSTLNSGLWHSFEDLRQERLNSGRILANKDTIDR